MRFKYSPLYWWWRKMGYRDYQLDDRHIPQEFWYSINSGWYEMNREHYWGKNYQPEVITLSERDFDALQRRLAEPPDPKVIERFKEIMSKTPPWKDE